MNILEFLKTCKARKEEPTKSEPTPSKKITDNITNDTSSAKTQGYHILDFYLDCSYWRQQNEILKKEPLALPVHRIDVENDDDTVTLYHVNKLPKLILVDKNGKEIRRWEGITQSEEINNFLFENGYAERPAPRTSPSSVSKDKIKQTDITLAGQFVAESLGGGIDYCPYTGLSEDFNIMGIQQQYSRYCLMAKSNLVMDSMGNPNPLISALKDHLLTYLANPANRTNKAMRYLYELQEKDSLIQQLSMLTLHANLKHANDIFNLSREEFRGALNSESVSLSLGLYIYFTILANPSVSEDDFNELFIESWIKYYGNIQARMLMFKMRGNSWKEDFAGVLLDD